MSKSKEHEPIPRCELEQVMRMLTIRLRATERELVLLHQEVHRLAPKKPRHPMLPLGECCVCSNRTKHPEEPDLSIPALELEWATEGFSTTSKAQQGGVE